MVVVAITGASAERDAVATRLIEALTGRGRRVAVIASSTGPLAIDEPGKDSYEHAAAGAGDVLTVSGQRWAHMHLNEPAAPPRLEALTPFAHGADVVLALGFNSHAGPRLTVESAADAGSGAGLRVLAENCRQPAFRLDKAETIADLIERLSEESSHDE